ncbi:hypothetical protein [Roseomonas chloroacetimidivorans]|uniref:hypothetical protein n=1 Tax=Roseomonas chloroacetimidivorans TaxID=1766656 RepID=UPI003C740426
MSARPFRALPQAPTTLPQTSPKKPPVKPPRRAFLGAVAVLVLPNAGVALPSGPVIVGGEIITDPNEVQLIRLYRSLPEHMHGPFVRCFERAAAGMPLRDALIGFGAECGQDEAKAMAEAVVT